MCRYLWGQTGFIVALVLAVAIGLPGNMSIATLRFGECTAGGVLATLLTLVLRHMDTATPEATAMDNGSATVLDWQYAARHALHRAVAAALAIALAKLFRLEHGSWLALTVLVIIKPDYSGTRQRAIERVGGSILGGAIALILAAVVRNVMIIDVLLLGLSVLAFSQLRRSYPLFVVYLTPFVVLMLNMIKPGDWRIALVRIEETLAGGALAIATALLFRAMETGSPQDPAAERPSERSNV